MKRNVIAHSAMHFIFISVVSDFLVRWLLFYSLFVECINLLCFSLLILTLSSFFIQNITIFYSNPAHFHSICAFILSIHILNPNPTVVTIHMRSTYEYQIRISFGHRIVLLHFSIWFVSFFSRVSVGISIISCQSRSIYSQI